MYVSVCKKNTQTNLLLLVEKIETEFNNAKNKEHEDCNLDIDIESTTIFIDDLCDECCPIFWMVFESNPPRYS